MADKTGIEWTDATWNPIRGCSRVSEGCRHCYAETVASRFSGAGLPYERLTTLGKWNGYIKFVEEHLLNPLKWKSPLRIFVNTMSDLFHPNVTDEMLDKIFAVMAMCPEHTFQILTKRPERMLAYLIDPETPVRVIRALFHIGDESDVVVIDGLPRMHRPMLPNVWLGVSVENQAAADERIPLLLQTPAAVRFLSCEPLLGSVQLLWDTGWGGEDDPPLTGGIPEGDQLRNPHYVRYGTSRLDWVICGGESGPVARPMHPDWARSLRDQCVAAGVPFFFKQHGEWISLSDYDPFVLGFDAKQYRHEFVWRPGVKSDAELPISCYRVGKKAAGDLLDGVQWHQFPSMTQTLKGGDDDAATV